MWPHRLYGSWNFPGQNTGEGSLSLLHRIFPTQGLNPGLLHCRRILHSLSYQGSPTHIYIYPCIYSVHRLLFHISVLPSEILFCLKNFLLVKWVLVYEWNIFLASMWKSSNSVTNEGKITVFYHCSFRSVFFFFFFFCLSSFTTFSLLLFSIVLLRQWHPTPVLLPGKSHGRRNLVGCSPWDR